MNNDSQNITIQSISGNASKEEIMAITAAINAFYSGGCEEKVLTIKNNHSYAWNSKILGMQQLQK